MRSPQRWAVHIYAMLCLLLPVALFAAWDGVYADAAYAQANPLRAVAQHHPADVIGRAASVLSHPHVTGWLGALGWSLAGAAWFGLGRRARAPLFAIAAVGLLALHPLQGRTLGLMTGFLVGAFSLLSLLWTSRRSRRCASPPPTLLLRPLLLWSITLVATSLLTSTLQLPTSNLQLPISILQLWLAWAFARLVPDLQWLTRPRRAPGVFWRVTALLALIGVAFGSGWMLVRDWRYRPLARLALYRDLGAWARANVAPGDEIATQRPGAVGYLAERPVVALPVASAPEDASALIAALEIARPAYCLALDGSPWDGVRAHPWFRAHYAPVHAAHSPYDGASPLTLYQYTATPFDAGVRRAVDAAFEDTSGRIEVVAFQASAERLRPGEPLYISVAMRGETDAPFRAVLRLVAVADRRVWWQEARAAPGGLPTDLWPSAAEITAQYELLPPEELPPGRYTLTWAFEHPDGEVVSLVAGAATPSGALHLTELVFEANVGRNGQSDRADSQSALRLLL